MPVAIGIVSRGGGMLLTRCALACRSPRRPAALGACPLEAQREARNLRRLKKAIRDRWGQIPLIDMVTEAALRTGMLGQLTAVGPREALARAALWERLGP
jgi:hypothetical protein